MDIETKTYNVPEGYQFKVTNRYKPVIIAEKGFYKTRKGESVYIEKPGRKNGLWSGYYVNTANQPRIYDTWHSSGYVFHDSVRETDNDIVRKL
jgi:hypothetical protein